MRAPRLLPLLVLMPTMAACGSSYNDPDPGGATVGEARAIDEAAVMIDERRTPAEVLVEEPIIAAPAPEGE